MAERRTSSPRRDPATAASDRPSRSSPVEDARAAAEAQEIVDQLRADFQERDRLLEATEAVLWSTYELNVPDAYRTTTQEVRSPLQLNIASTIAAALSTNPQNIAFEPIGQTQKAELNAELREHFFEASWRRQEHEARRQLLRVFLWSLVTKGEGVLKTVERSKRAWQGYTAYGKRLREELEADGALTDDERERRYDRGTEAYKQGQPYPIASTDVVPESFYYYLTPDGIRYAAEVQDVPYLEALDRFGAGVDRNGNVVREEAMGLPRPEWSRALGGARTITCVELWDYRSVRYFLLSGNQLGKANGRQLGTGTLVRHIRRHGYGDPYCKVLRGPYFHALGITTASRLPERAGLSVLYPFLSLFKALDSYLTIQSNAAYQTGFPSFKRTQPPGSSLAASLGQVAGPQVAPFGLDGSERDALAAQVTRIEPGSIYPWDVAPIEQPRAGADLDKIVAAIRGFLELALPSAVQGVVAGDMSGYALNQAAHLARLAWDPILKNAQVALSDRVGFESWLIERKVGERVYAWGEVPGSGARVRRPMATQQAGPAGWLGVGPEELGGSHRYTVTLEPDIPSDRALEVRTHVELVQAGFETTAMAIEALGGDPGEVERGLILENVKRSEFVQSRLMQRIQQGLGMMDAQELATIGAGPDGMPQLPPEMQAMLAAAGGVPPGAPPGLAGPAGAASPGLNGIGGFGSPLPGPLAPGMGMPLQPTPQGSVGGMGPPGAVPPNGANIPGGLPGTPSGTPVIPSPPANARPIPGRS